MIFIRHHLVNKKVLPKRLSSFNIGLFSPIHFNLFKYIWNSINVLICLHTSLFSPFLQCSILVLGVTYDIYIYSMPFLQKRVIKAISFQNFISPSTPIFSDLETLKLHDLFQLKLLLCL